MIHGSLHFIPHVYNEEHCVTREHAILEPFHVLQQKKKVIKWSLKHKYCKSRAYHSAVCNVCGIRVSAKFAQCFLFPSFNQAHFSQKPQFEMSWCFLVSPSLSYTIKNEIICNLIISGLQSITNFER